MEKREEQYWSEEDIPDEIRATLETVYADPNPGRWDWDEGTWRWELSLYSDENADGEGYVYIGPCKNGKPFEYAIVPSPWHDEWVIGNICPKDIYIRGTLQEAKNVLDTLIRPTPEIPIYLFLYMTIQAGAPVMSAEDFKSLIPGDLIRDSEHHWLFLVEHVVPEYPTPGECRIYVRYQGEGEHGKQIMFQLADHESLKFFRRVRKPLPVLRELIRCLEPAERVSEPDYDIARSIGISRAQVDCLRDTVINRPELVPPLLDGTLPFDEVCYAPRRIPGSLTTD
jgi:hypothetical protein